MYSTKQIKRLFRDVTKLEQDAIAAEQRSKPLLKEIHSAHFASARNLLHYLSVRSNDLTTLQHDLSCMAVSSQSHAEAHTLNNLQKIKYILNAIGRLDDHNIVFDPLDCDAGDTIAKQKTAALFGKPAFNGQTKIMVTLSTQMADDYPLVLELVKTGMDVARINTAHDHIDTWQKMVANVNKAARAARKNLKLYFDLQGPKIRTVSIIETQVPDHQVIPFMLIRKGEQLKILKKGKAGHSGTRPEITISHPEILENLRKGERVWFDDGKLGGTIARVHKDYLLVDTTNIEEEGFKLKAGKGLNFPESALHIPALTKTDLQHLPFIVRHADMIGFSFVQRPEDVHALQKQLKKIGGADKAIILKIETHAAFVNLPALLLAAMRSPACGIMIARGDLAVEIGHLRLAEVQEEILWLAEAAHLPVIWATQVLDKQAKKGTPTRAEVSDAVKAVRADCVMLNKGTYVAEAIKTLKDIDKRMAAHEDKKVKKLRALHVAKAFIDSI